MSVHVGHEREMEIFSKAIQNKRLLHAYIFSGKEGSGKKQFAVNLAKSIFCRNGRFFKSCACPACTQIDNNSHPDFKLVEESPAKIDTIREINLNAGQSPLSAPMKIFVIDNAHTMRKEAANAFLKTLEEPGEDTLMILITDKYEMLLPTIRSRCVRINFTPLCESDVLTVLDDLYPDRDNSIAAKLSSGSVSFASYLAEKEVEALNTSSLLSSPENLWDTIDKFKEKEEVRIFCTVLYASLLDNYRNTKNSRYAELANYLLDILRRLDYNINLDIFKTDLYIKITEVIQWQK